MLDMARITKVKVDMQAVSPANLLDSSIMLSYSDPGTALGPTEQLYTARGAQGFGTYEKISKLGVLPSNFDEVVQLIYTQSHVEPIHYEMRPLFTTKTTPDFL